MNMTMKTSFLATVVALFAAVTFDSAHAELVSAVSGSSQNGGEPNSLFIVDTTTGEATNLGMASVVPNALAFNVEDNVFYYGNHNNNEFYFFDPLTGTDMQIGSGPTGTRYSGPGDYAGGRYYWVAEGPSGSPLPGTSEVRYFEFSPDGKSIANSGVIDVTLPAGADGFGDFGDIAINPVDGIMWGGSSEYDPNANEVVGIFTINILDANPTLTVINPLEGLDGNGIQMAFNGNGELFANRFDNQAEILPIDLTNGILGAGVPLVNTTADFFDMATVVPEPCTLPIALLGLCTLWSRSRRRS